jgi:hypothetical protein
VGTTEQVKNLNKLHNFFLPIKNSNCTMNDLATKALQGPTCFQNESSMGTISFFWPSIMVHTLDLIKFPIRI